MKISIGGNSQITTFVGYLHDGRTYSRQRIMDRNTFIKVVSGYWPSEFNPERTNYFEENGIDCGVLKDSITLEEFCYCDPFDSLWKIRFSMYPFRNGPLDEGWSPVLHKPSLKQDKYLYDRYGVKSVDFSFFLDTSFWMLLHDVSDSNWIANYKSLK